jgi:hypothetical protein
MSQASRLIVLLAAAAIGLAGTPAAAQSEDERIMREGSTPVGGTDTPPPETEEEELDEQVFYSGMGISQVETDFTNLDKAFNLDVTLGFRIPTVKWLGIEIDIGQTIIPGENKTAEQSGLSGGGNECLINPSPLDPDGFPNGCSPSGSAGSQETVSQDPDELQMQALGLSLALKSTGRFYVLGRYGYRYIATSIDELNVNRGGTGFGAGVGYRWGKGLSGVELQYKQLSEEVDSIGLTFFARLNRR